MMTVNPFYQKQFLWGLMGLGGMLLVMLFDYRHLKTLAWPIFCVTVCLLVAVPLWGKTIYGARRWLSLGLFNFQPSEAAKIAILIMGARLLSRGQEKLDFIPLLGVLAVGMIPAGLVIMQPDLGSGLNLLLLLGGIILYRGMTARVVKVLAVIIPAVMPLGWLFMHDYQRQRVLTFLDPSNDPLGAGYHIIQSQIAIGSGRMWGKGFFGGHPEPAAVFA